MPDLKLAALLCSRLCHDLVGPIGAIGNGIEILSEEADPEMRAQAIGLLERSAKQATARLRFFRLAFGSAGSDDVPLSIHDACEAAKAMFDDGKVALSWPPVEGGEPNLSKVAVRLVLNLALVAGATLIRGGELSVRLAPAPPRWRAVLSAQGPTVHLDEQLRAILSGGRQLAEIEVRESQTYYAWALAEALESRIEINQPDTDRIELIAELA